MNKFNFVTLGKIKNKYKILQQKYLSVNCAQYIVILEKFGFEYGGDYNGSAYNADFLIDPLLDQSVKKEKLNGLKVKNIYLVIKEILSQRKDLSADDFLQYVEMYRSLQGDIALLGAGLILNYASYNNLYSYRYKDDKKVVDFLAQLNLFLNYEKYRKYTKIWKT